MIGKEYERYEKALKVEDIGGEEEVLIVHKDGKEYTATKKKTIDNGVSNLAMNIIKSGKLLNEILNPPKAVPFFQQNIQNNFNVNAAEEIRNLPSSEKENVLKFIDDKLDVARKN